MYSLTKHFTDESVPRLENKLGVAFTQEFVRKLKEFDKVPQTILFRNNYRQKDMILAKVDGHYLVFCVNPYSKTIITVFSLPMYMETVADCEKKYYRNADIAKSFMERN